MPYGAPVGVRVRPPSLIAAYYVFPSPSFPVAFHGGKKKKKNNVPRRDRRAAPDFEGLQRRVPDLRRLSGVQLHVQHGQADALRRAWVAFERNSGAPNITSPQKLDAIGHSHYMGFF